MASKDYTNLLCKDSLTAEDFARVWEHFDEDGNGYIEGSELTSFFKELIKSKPGNNEEEFDESEFQDRFKEMMARYDQNKDGKIEMRELAEILPPEESFLVLFRSQQPLSSIEFMEIWRRFDSDSSGFIEVNELKSFMKHLITKNQLGDISDDKLDEYAKSILKLFDANNDGKLELKEMAKLLPTKENFLKQFQKRCEEANVAKPGQKTLTRSEFERVFSYYDKDKNGTIEGDELNGFLKDLMEHEGNEELNMTELEKCCGMLLKVCDKNGDGIIQKTELEMFIRPSDCQEPQE
eukprot:XP_011667667.1 PREDICTED: calretinin isoform X3 [Strongylocentrotus purpuratus]